MYTTLNQFTPGVAADTAGNFIIEWVSTGSAGTDTSGVSIQAQRYDSAGIAQGEFQVNAYTTGNQLLSAVATDSAGNFIITWSSFGSAGTDTDSLSIQARRYDSGGVAQGGEFQVNTYTTSVQSFPAVATDSAGNFVIAWRSNGSAGDTNGYSVQARRYDSAGTAQGGEYEVNTYTTSNQDSPAVAADSAGNFVIAWMSTGSAGTDNDNYSVQAQRYDGAGIAQGDEFQVNTYITGSQAEPRPSFDSGGNMIVAWTSAVSGGTDTDGASVQLKRYALGRTLLGKKILVKDPTGGEIQRSAIVLGKETATDIGATILGDPVANGATLRVLIYGNADSDETYLLDPVGWSTLGSTGFKYAGLTGGDGDPVKKIILKRTPNGNALMKVLFKGNVGAQDLEVVPPNGGDSYGGIILSIHGGGTYCTTFGLLAGGSEVRDDAQIWKFVNAGAEECVDLP